jgi:alginate O-acetyltransferase complex protein AlgI
VREKTGVIGDPAGIGNRLALALLTYALVNVTWVFFRADSFGGAARILRGMAGLATEAKPVLATMFVVKVVVIVTAIVVTQWIMRNRSLEDVVAGTPWWVTAVVCAAMLFAVTITQGSGQAFIYFQF